MVTEKLIQFQMAADKNNARSGFVRPRRWELRSGGGHLFPAAGAPLIGIRRGDVPRDFLKSGLPTAVEQRRRVPEMGETLGARKVGVVRRNASAEG